MSTLRFTRDETTNDVSFRVATDDGTIILTLSLSEFAMALMAGKKVNVKYTRKLIHEEAPVKKKGKVKKKK